MTIVASIVFRDTKTPVGFVEDFEPLGDDGEIKAAAKPDHIIMDAMGFGMGCCCLQVSKSIHASSVWFSSYGSYLSY